MENPIKMDDLGGKPTIFGSTPMYLLLNMKIVHCQPGLNILLHAWDPQKCQGFQTQ